VREDGLQPQYGLAFRAISTASGYGRRASFLRDGLMRSNAAVLGQRRRPFVICGEAATGLSLAALPLIHHAAAWGRAATTRVLRWPRRCSGPPLSSLWLQFSARVPPARVRKYPRGALAWRRHSIRPRCVLSFLVTPAKALPPQWSARHTHASVHRDRPLVVWLEPIGLMITIRTVGLPISGTRQG
jgi:hypothetical protein